MCPWKAASCTKEVAIGAFTHTGKGIFVEKRIAMQKSIFFASVQTHEKFRDRGRKISSRGRKVQNCACPLVDLKINSISDFPLARNSNSINWTSRQREHRMFTLCAVHRGIDQTDFRFARGFTHTALRQLSRWFWKIARRTVNWIGSRRFLKIFCPHTRKKSKFASRCKNRFSNFTFCLVCERH